MCAVALCEGTSLFVTPEVTVDVDYSAALYVPRFDDRDAPSALCPLPTRCCHLHGARYINFPLTTGLAGQSNSGTYLIDNWSMTPGTPIAAPTCGPICDATGIVYIQSLGQFASTSGSGNPIATLNNVPYYAADGTGMGCASP